MRSTRTDWRAAIAAHGLAFAGVIAPGRMHARSAGRLWPKSSSALHQRNARVVPVHEQTDAQADGEEYRHDQRNRLDGLAGLIQRGVRDRHDVLIADRNSKR